MLWRLAFPLLFFLAPRFIPKLVRYMYLVWKLTLDRRVNILLRLLVPATVLVAAFLAVRIPVLGIIGAVVVLAIGVKALVGLAPREVVQEYAPWRQPNRGGEGRGGNDPSKVVEGKYRMVDDDSEPKNHE